MAFSSLFTLFDDIASILDDVSMMTKMAAKKTAGVVGDDLALNADQVTGASPDRELPIVWAVAKGSFINKLILVPVALLLSVFAPFLIVPLLMIGGAYLCFEGVEKLLHKFFHKNEHTDNTVKPDEVTGEKEKIKGAIRTDFILSAEIIIIALGVLGNSPLLTKILVLSTIGIGITVIVYGLVALIVKADDFGLRLIKNGGATAALGKAIITFMPWFMRGLSFVGTVAMFLVGGGIFTHNISSLHHFLETNGFAAGPTGMLADLIVGLIVGAIVCLVVLPLIKVFGKKTAH